MSDQIGYHSFLGTGLNEEILASEENLVHTSVTIDSTCRDTTNAVITDLRRGLILFPDPTTTPAGQWTQLDAAAVTATLEDKVVVLAHPVDISGGDVVAKVYESGVFKTGKLLDDSGTTLTHFNSQKAQRIVIRPQQ